MCFDTSTGVLYVSGGRIVGTDMCSGLYAYHTVDKEWLCLVADQSANVPLQSALPRSGHVTLFHPVRLHVVTSVQALSAVLCRDNISSM